jgi:glycosyltransferase involved in cell wall biosynthesis
MKPLNIVLPVHHFPPRYSAGAELYTFRLARWLLDRGHQVEVVCVEAIDQGSVGELAVVHDQYEGIPVWRLSYNIFDAPERRRWDFDNPLIGAWFAKYLETNRPDIIHFQAAYLLSAAPFRAARAAGIPTVLTLHDYWLLCPRITLRRGDNSLCETIPENPAGCAWCNCTEQRRYQIADQITFGLAGALAQQTLLRGQASLIAERRKTLGAVLAQVDHVIAPSTFLARRYAAQVAPERMTTLRYGLDLARFVQLPPKRNQGPLRIGFTGQMAPHKGVHLLIEAFRQLRSSDRPVELHLYGGLEALPAYVAELRAKAGDDQRITFHGRFEHREAPGILAGLDVAVVPSTWYENSPLAIMEAHAAGTPVVTANLGGMAELVRDEVDGLHFAPNQAHDLARALQRLIDEPELLSQLQAGITLPPSIDQESSTLLAIYEQVNAESRLSAVSYA